MHRIDGAGNVGGMFVSEDPATNRPPTEITPEIMNALQEEIVQVIQWAGFVLNKLDNTQLKQALLAQFALKTDLNAQYLAVWVSGSQYAQGDLRVSPLDGGVYRCSAAISGAVDPHLDFQHWASTSSNTPTGAIDDFELPAAPPGWLELNGNAVLISDIPRLNNVMYCGDVHNATAEYWYRCTDPQIPNASRSPTGAYLVLRDARGMFRRAWDHGRGIDVGRALGSYQSDANQQHSHLVDDPGHDHITNRVAVRNMSADDLPIYMEYVDGANNPIQKRTGTSSTGISIFDSGEPDARPKNYAVLTCIKC